MITIFVTEPGKYVRVLYTNYKGETAWRHIQPLDIPPRRTTPDDQYHPNTWVLEVWDLDKNAQRSYALKDIHKWVEAGSEMYTRLEVEGPMAYPEERTLVVQDPRLKKE
jgi:hypothetical protein